MEDPYQQIGHLYDDIVGDQRETIRYLKRLIRKHAPRAKSILEIACGTGAILTALSDTFDVVGLDASEVMLAQAQQKLPDAPLFQADMRDFNLGNEFDVVLCVFDSINHLTRLTDWKKTFRNVRHHLSSRGVFIFDFNTPYRLEQLSLEPPMVHDFEKGTYILNVEKRGKNRFFWNARIFTQLSEGLFSCVEDSIPESTYPLETVQELLSPFFTVRSVQDPERTRRTAKSKRLYCVCEAA